MKTGTIIQVNHRGIFIVAIDDGDYALFEQLDSIDLQVGDKLQGDLDALGGEELLHLEQGHHFSTYGQTGPSSLAACRGLL